VNTAEFGTLLPTVCTERFRKPVESIGRACKARSQAILKPVCARLSLHMNPHGVLGAFSHSS
jgi:hypothetical protein